VLARPTLGLRSNNRGAVGLFPARMWRAIILMAVVVALLGPATGASADRVLEQRTLFAGHNVYSPVVENVAGGQAMWYGGWQTKKDQAGGDKIYRRFSSDGIAWGAHTTVLTPADMPGGSAAWRHVNDPSITIDGGPKPYTMFFTACRNPCAVTVGNEIWSAESVDGVNWTNLKPLLAGFPHPAEPSATAERSGAQEWKVYYTGRSECGKVKVVSVDAEREVIGEPQTVLSTSRPASCLLNPEVKYFHSAWHIFYERSDFGTNRRDIEESESDSNTSWRGFNKLIENDGPTYCATVGPGVRPLAGGNYDMFVGLTRRRSDGTCEVSYQGRIERWRWRRPLAPLGQRYPAWVPFPIPRWRS